MLPFRHGQFTGRTEASRDCQHAPRLPALRRPRGGGFECHRSRSPSSSRSTKAITSFAKGAPAQGFYIAQKGAINVHRVNAAGKEQVIHVFRAGESFAEAALATASGYPADARALESSQVLLVEKSGFLALLRRQPELALRMLGSMSLHLRTLIAQLEDLTLKDVETRLANWLIKRCPNPESAQPVAIELKTTKRVLAAELGTVSETFSRTLAKFRQQKLVTVKGKTLTVRCPLKLKELLHRNLGE